MIELKLCQNFWARTSVLAVDLRVDKGAHSKYQVTFKAVPAFPFHCATLCSLSTWMHARGQLDCVDSSGSPWSLICAHSFTQGHAFSNDNIELIQLVALPACLPQRSSLLLTSCQRRCQSYIGGARERLGAAPGKNDRHCGCRSSNFSDF